MKFFVMLIKIKLTLLQKVETATCKTDIEQRKLYFLFHNKFRTKSMDVDKVFLFFCFLGGFFSYLNQDIAPLYPLNINSFIYKWNFKIFLIHKTKYTVLKPSMLWMYRKYLLILYYQFELLPTSQLLTKLCTYVFVLLNKNTKFVNTLKNKVFLFQFVWKYMKCYFYYHYIIL